MVSNLDDRLVRQDYEGLVRGKIIEGSVILSGGTKKASRKWRAERIGAGD